MSPRLEAALAIGLGLVLIGAWVALAGGDHFLGAPGVDFYGTQWFYWLLGRRVLVEEPFAHTDLIFHPWGKDVYLHTGGNVLDAVAALPFRFLFGPVLGYNLFLAAILLSNGLAGARLGGALGVGARGATGAGMLAAAAPFVGWELHGGRPTQAILAPAALFLAAWLQPAGPRPGRSGALAGLWMGLTGLTYWFYAIFCAILAALCLPWRWSGGPVDRGREARFVVAAVGVALALALPLAYPMLRALAEGSVPGLLPGGAGAFVPRTVEGWEIAVASLDPLSGRAGFYVEEAGRLRFTDPLLVLSPCALLLAAIGLAAGPKPARGLLPLAGALLLAAGPVVEPRLAWGNAPYQLLVALVPPLARLWWPARATALVGLLLLPWAARALDRGPRGSLLVLLAVLVGELGWIGLLPAASTPAAVPPAIACLGRGQGALLELPYAGHPERLLHQVLHGRPRLGGMLEDNPVFAPAAQRAFLVEDPATAALIAMAEGGPAPAAPLDFGPLRAQGVHTLVLDRASLGPRRGAHGDQQRAERALIELLGRPAYADAETLIYNLDGAPVDCP